MTTIVTRTGKGSPLTHVEVDTNFTNLNTNKLETAAIPLGTAAAPSISFSSDADTGIYSPAANQLAVATNGTQKLAIDSSGRVGIGTSSPNTSLVVSNAGLNGFEVNPAGPGGTTSLLSFNRNTSSYTDFLYDGSSYRFQISGTERLRIDSAGNVGIGTASPQVPLHVVGATETLRIQAATNNLAFLRIINDNETSATKTLNVGIGGPTASSITAWQNAGFIDSEATNGLTLSTTAGPIVFAPNSRTERARIDSSGRLLVGTSTSRGNFYNAAGYNPLFQIEGTNAYSGSAISALSIVHNAADDWGAAIYLGKSRSASVGGNALVSNGDTFARISMQAADGSEMVEGARIEAQVDGTPGANDMPGRLVFSTTADGAASPTEAMRINSQQELLVGTATRTANGGKLQLSGGITFPATAVAASDANTLDDYEEGTFTPLIRDALGNTATMGNQNTGTYIKIGRLVRLQGLIHVSSTAPLTTGSSLRLEAIPFTTGSLGGTAGERSVSTLISSESSSPGYVFQLSSYSASTVISLSTMKPGVTPAYAATVKADLGSGNVFMDFAYAYTSA